MEEGVREARVNSKLLLATLGFSTFTVWLITVTFQLLLIEVAQTFQVQVGTASMTAAVGSISGIAAGLLMAVLSVRYNHKKLLLSGLACTCLAAVGFYLAPTFTLLLVPNIGVGAGIAIVTARAYSIIGDSFPLQRRGKAIGVITAATTMAFVVGGPVIGAVAGVFGWRMVMLLLILPVTLSCLTLAFLVIPNRPKQASPIPDEKEPFLAGCRDVLKNRSAIASLSVTMFMLAEGAVAFYLISFFREQFAIGVDLGAVVVMAGNILSAVGGVAAGFLVNRLGRKPLGAIAFLASASLTLLFSFMPTFPLSFGLSALRFWFGGMSITAGSTLVIEQLPKFRGTMMSLNAVAMNLGMLTASLLGGLTLNLYNYQTLAMVLGGLGITGALIWVTLVNDPYAKRIA